MTIDLIVGCVAGCIVGTVVSLYTSHKLMKKFWAGVAAAYNAERKEAKDD